MTQQRLFCPTFATALTLCFSTVCAAPIHPNLSTLFLETTVRAVAMTVWALPFYVTCTKKEPSNICCYGLCDKDQTYPNFTNFILVLSCSSSVLLSVEGQAAVRWGVSGNGEMVPCQVRTKDLGGVIPWELLHAFLRAPIFFC